MRDRAVSQGLAMNNVGYYDAIIDGLPIQFLLCEFFKIEK